jgi:hypothetical protein
MFNKKNKIMTPEQENSHILQGFNNGYMLSIYNPKILDRLLTLPHIPAYKEGLEKGIATYEKHKSLLLNSRAKLQERKAKLAKIKAQEKSIDKNEKEL